MGQQQKSFRTNRGTKDNTPWH